jgi:ribosomal protein S18 acetylase RimI-like enzyme
MFLYELGVDEASRRQGIGSALVNELAVVARQAGCYGMWVLTEDENLAALATYRRAGGSPDSANRMLVWEWSATDSKN